MKSLWTTIAVGAALIGAYFLIRSNVAKEYEGKFVGWTAEFRANYRTEPETTYVDTGSIRYVTKWKAAKPRELTVEEQRRIAQNIFGLTLAQRDSLLALLSEPSETGELTDSSKIGDSVHVFIKYQEFYDPFATFGEKHGLRWTPVKVVYPRGGTTFVEPEEAGVPILSGLFIKIGAKSEIGNWKNIGGTGGITLPFNVGGDRQLIPQIEYGTLDKRGFVKLELSQKVF